MDTIRFKNVHDPFYDALKEKVNAYFTRTGKSRFADGYMNIKIVFFISGTLVFYYLIFKSHSLPLVLLNGFVFGIFSFLSALNISHDAAHSAISRHKRLNSACLYILNFIGVNSYIWKLKHLGSHHTFPNVKGTDSDIGESRIGRLVPAARIRWFTRFQHYYIPLLYLFYSAHWVLFKDFIHFKTLRVPNKKKLTHPMREYFVLLIGKLFALCTTVILPYFYLDITVAQTVLLFFVIHFGPGLMVAVFLVPAHLNSEVSYPEPDEKGFINTSWAHHQVITTVDYSTSSKVFNFLLGGFNHHVAHHLFPSICHCHYPHITPLIEETAGEYKIPYKSTGYVRIFLLHLLHLKMLGSASKPVEHVNII